jgi:Peptidase_C39 like family
MEYLIPQRRAMRKHMLRSILILVLSAAAGSPLAARDLSIGVPYYSQGKDAPWAEETLGLRSSVTIRTHGCALTAISMVFSHFTGEEITPPVMNRWLKRNDGFEDDPDLADFSGQVIINWPALTAYGSGWVYTRFDWRAKPADILLIEYYLEHGIPVIAEVLYKGAPHYVVLTGYDENGFTMHDPQLPEEHHLDSVYTISDKWGSGASRNILGVRVLYPEGYRD